MADEDRWDPLLPAVGCKPRPRERLWTLMKNGKRVDAELLFHAEHGVEIQFIHEGDGVRSAVDPARRGRGRGNIKTQGARERRMALVAGLIRRVMARTDFESR